MQITLPIRRPHFRRLRVQCRRWAIPSLMFLAALPVYAQTGSDPWDNAMGVLKKLRLEVDPLSYWTPTNTPRDNLRKLDYFARFGPEQGLIRLAEDYPNPLNS